MAAQKWLVYLRFTGNQGKPSQSVPGTTSSRHIVDADNPQEAAHKAYLEVKELHEKAGEPPIVVSLTPYDPAKDKKGLLTPATLAPDWFKSMSDDGQVANVPEIVPWQHLATQLLDDAAKAVPVGEVMVLKAIHDAIQAIAKV